MLCLFPFHLLPAATAKDTSGSKIDSVTVYPDRAMVTRQRQVTLTPGRHTLKFKGLPLSLNDRSVQVKGKGTARAKILDVSVKREFLVEKVNIKQGPLQQRREQVMWELRTLSDRTGTLSRKQKLLDKLIDKTVKSIGAGEKPQPVSQLSIDLYRKMLLFQEEQIKGIKAQAREISRKRGKLEKEKEAIDKKLNWDPSSTAIERKTVAVDVFVKAGGTLKLSASYLVPGASWSPSYDLRVDGVDGKDSLTYSAIIKQQTGEDWKNVRLTLSTAQPMKTGEVPNLSPVYLDLVKPGSGIVFGKVKLGDGSELPGVSITVSGNGIKSRQTVSSATGTYRVTDLPSGRYDVVARLTGFNTVQFKSVQITGGKTNHMDITMNVSSIQETVVVTGKTPGINPNVFDSLPTAAYHLDGVLVKDLLNQTAGISYGELAMTFSVKHRETISSSKEGTRVTVADQGVEVSKEYVAVPSRSRHVVLVANIKNTMDMVLLSGPVNLFFEGSYINEAYFQRCHPGDTVKLPIGIDESISVERMVLEEKSKTTGFFKSKNLIPMGYSITARSRKKKTITLTLRDRMPVSKNNKVKVDIEVLTPKPEKNKKDNGLLTWRLPLKPGEIKEVRVKYVISHPKDRILRKE